MRSNAAPELPHRAHDAEGFAAASSEQVGCKGNVTQGGEAASLLRHVVIEAEDLVEKEDPGRRGGGRRLHEKGAYAPLAERNVHCFLER